ncbi:MAG: glycosyltransferase family 4 protein [Nitrososphaeria archaeon]
MNIVHIYNGSLEGGVLKVAVEECKHLNILGNTSIIVTSLCLDAYKEVYFQPKLPINFKSSYFLSPFLCSVSTIIRPKLPKNFKPDWIIAQNIYSIMDALRLARETRAKSCLIIHSGRYSLIPTYVFSSLTEKREKVVSMLHEFDLIIAVNKKLAKKFNEEAHIDVKYIPLGCLPIKEFPDKRRNFALCISRLSFGKRIDIVARLLSMADKSYLVIFAGHRTSTTGKVFKKIKDYGLKNFKIVYNLPDEMLCKLNSMSKFFIGFSSGLPPLEAAAHGSPVVCDYTSWADEYFVDGVHGFIYKNDYEIFSKGPRDVKTLMLDDAKALKMGYNAWKLVKEKFTWMHHTRKLEELLRAGI